MSIAVEAVGFMSVQVLEKISQINKDTHIVFLMTCDREGVMQADGVMSIESLTDQDLKIRGWFSSLLISNLDTNPHMTLIIWNIHDHQGYQLKGKCIQKNQIAFLDGFMPGKEGAIPQVE